MRIDIGHINKRINSTKTKFTKSYSNVTVRLKEPTSVINPTFILKNTTSNGYKFSSSTNYIYVPDWGYYWIMDIVYLCNDVIEFVCARDVAATGKDYIKKVKAYVKYCSDLSISTEAGLLDDDRFGPDLYLGTAVENLATTPLGNTPSLLDTLFTHNIDDGCIILDTIGKDIGLVHWCLDFHEFLEVMIAMATEAAGSTLDQITAAFFGDDWKSCVTGARYLPLKKTEVESWPIFVQEPAHVWAGSVEVTNATCKYTMSPIAGKRNTYRRPIPFIDICKKSHYEFLRGPKYTSVIFQYTGGSIDISNECLTDYSQIYVEETILITGDFSIKIYGTDVSGDKGPLLGAICENLSTDISSALSYTQSSADQGLNLVTNVLKSSLQNGATGLGVSMTPSSITSSVTETGPSEKVSETAKGGYSIVNSAGSRTMSTTKTYDSKVDIGSGIIGAFTNTGASPVGRAVSAQTSLASYFTYDLNNSTSATDTYRIVSSTNVPEAFYDEPTGPQTPTSAVRYEAFGKMYGFPCNKYVDLKYIHNEDFVQCVGANCGNVNTSDITWTLTTYELTKLNEMLNTGIYLEDWERETPPTT